MMLALLKVRNLSIAALLLAATGCSTVERVILPTASAQRVVVQQDYIDFEEIQELNRFTQELEGQPEAVCAAQLPQVEQEFVEKPTVVNRFRYALLLAYAGENPKNYDTALSLFDDKAMAQLQYNTYWVVFARQVKTWIEVRAELAEANTRLLEERAKVLAENEKLQKELQAKVARLAKVEEQLNALKSIEKSILERDIGEESAKP